VGKTSKEVNNENMKLLTLFKTIDGRPKRTWARVGRPWFDFQYGSIFHLVVAFNAIDSASYAVGTEDSSPGVNKSRLEAEHPGLTQGCRFVDL
jgi:hypothetical protein